MSGSNFRSPPHTLLTSNIVNFLEFYSQERKSTTKRRPVPSPATVSGLSAFIDSHFADATTANALNTCTVVLRKKKDNSLKNSPFDGVRLSNYRLRPSDVPREVFDWVSHFLWLKNCPLELATIIATRVASRMSTEMTSPSSELKPALVASSPESSGAAFSQFSNDQDSIDFSYEPRSSGLPSALCSVDVARQSRDMVDDMLEEMAADPAKTVEMVLDYNRSDDGPTLGWGDDEEHTTSSPAVPASPKGFTSSLCAIKNGRKTMEDRHIIIHDLNKALGLKCAKQYSYYAIFDGHAGVDAATYSTAHLHHNLVGSAAFAEGRIEDAFKEAFEITDSLYVKRTKEDGVDQLKASGTTALCALIEDQKTVYLAWVGDSQAVLVRNGSHEEIMLPHKPEMDSERTRIQDLGGLVVFVDTWRVNGILSVTRAIGDPDHKPYINAEPSLAKFTIDSSLDFLVLGCDGLFDQLTGQDIASHVFEYLCKNEQKEPQEVISGVSTYLSQMAIREGSTDNITSIVLFFKPFEQLVATGYPVEGEMADVTVVEADKTSSKTPSENADFQSILANNSLPTATNGGHFPYTDFSELPVGTNFNLHSMPPAATEDDVKEDKEDATASVMKNPFEGYEDSGFDFNGGAAAADFVDDYDNTASAVASEQAALDFETTDAMDDFTFTASATTDVATTVVPPAEESTSKGPEFFPADSPLVDSVPLESVPMSTTPVASTPVESAPPLTDWSQMAILQPQQESTAPVVEAPAEVHQSTSPFAFDDSKATEEFTASAAPPTTEQAPAVAADEWSQFEAPPVVDTVPTQVPEEVQEEDIFERETAETSAPVVPVKDEWSQFEAPPVADTVQRQEPEEVQDEDIFKEDIFKTETVETSVPAMPVNADEWSQFDAAQSAEETLEQTTDSAALPEDNSTRFDLKQLVDVEEQESATAALATESSALSHEVEEAKEDTEKISAPIDDSTFDMDTFAAVPNKVELVNSSSPFDTELFLPESKTEETVNSPEPIDSVPVAAESLATSLLDTTENVAESKTEETVNSPEPIDSVPVAAETLTTSLLDTPENVAESKTEETVNPPEPIDSVPVAVESLTTSLLDASENVAESKTEIAPSAPVDIEPKVVEEPATIPGSVAEPAPPVPIKSKAPSAAVGIKKPLASAGKAATLLSKAKPTTATSKVATKPTTTAKSTTEAKPGAIKRNVSSTLTAARSTVPKPAPSSTTTARPGLAKPSTTAPAASRPTTRPSPSATTGVSKVGSSRVGVTAKMSAVPKVTTTSTTARATPSVPKAPISRLAPAKTTTQSSTTAKATAETKPGAIKRTVPSSTLGTARSTTAASAPKPAAARTAVAKTSPAPTASRLASARPTPPPGTSRLGTTSRLTSAKPSPKAGVTASTAASKTAATKTTTTNGTSNGVKAVPKKPATGVNAAKVASSNATKPSATSTVSPTQANGSVKSYSAKRPMGVENSLKQELEDAVNGLNNGAVQQQSPPPVANGDEVNGINGHNGL